MITKEEIMNIAPGDVLVLSIDMAGLNQEEASARLEYERENNELIQYAEQLGHRVILTSDRVQPTVLSFKPGDRAVFYVDLCNMTPDVAKQFVQNVAANFKATMPDIDTMVIPKQHRLEVIPADDYDDDQVFC